MDVSHDRLILRDVLWQTVQQVLCHTKNATEEACPSRFVGDERDTRTNMDGWECRRTARVRRVDGA